MVTLAGERHTVRGVFRLRCHPGPPVPPGADGLLQLCVVGDDNDLWLMRQLTPAGDWSTWSRREAPPPAGLLGSPALVAGADGRLQLFVAGTDGALWHTGPTAN